MTFDKLHDNLVRVKAENIQGKVILLQVNKPEEVNSNECDHHLNHKHIIKPQKAHVLDLEDNEYEEVNGLSSHSLPNRWDGVDVKVRGLISDLFMFTPTN